MAIIPFLNNAYFSAKVGIGTDSPGAKLEVASNYDLVNGNIKLSTTDHSSGFPAITFYNESSSVVSGSRNWKIGVGRTSKGLMQFQSSLTSTGSADGNVIMTLDPGGNVGIGTTSPLSRLHVDGAGTLENHFTEGLRVTRETVPAQFGMFNYNGGALNIIAANTAGTGSITKFMRSSNGTSLNTSMVINTDGLVGIGTTDPKAKLHTYTGSSNNLGYDDSVGIIVEGATRSIVQINSTNDAYVMFGDVAQLNRAWVGYNHITDQLMLHTGGTITMDGNVGIGTDTPSDYDNNADNLVVGTTSGNNGITIASSPAGVSSLYFADGISGGGQYTGYLEYNHSSNYMRFGTNNGAERVRITSAGNVGIGTTNPQAKLDVAGGIRMADDSTAASSANVGTQRYRTSGNNSYVDMCMQTGASTYAWINIVQNNW